MNCKVCNTRLAPGSSACPNCGSHSSGGAKGPASEIGKPRALPGIAKGSSPLGIEEVETVDLNEPAEVDIEESRDEKEEAPPARAGGDAVRSSPLGVPDAIGLRAMLGDQPDLLEPGLAVHKNDKGTLLGVGYTSAVGEIDLLARDAKGNFVVIMIARPDQGEAIVSEILQRIGWVRKHLATGSHSVRGVVLMDRRQDAISYAAAAVADTVKFKTYRVALRFDDLDV